MNKDILFLLMLFILGLIVLYILYYLAGCFPSDHISNLTGEILFGIILVGIESILFIGYLLVGGLNI